jgi:hypothetical protein
MHCHEIRYEYHSSIDHHTSVFLKTLHPYQHGNHTDLSGTSNITVTQYMISQFPSHKNFKLLLCPLRP